LNLWDTFVRPDTLAQALEVMSTARQSILPMAGGTDLLVDLEQGRHARAGTLLDVTSIQELLMLEVRAASLFVGAAVPLAKLVRDPLIQLHAPALVDACELIGGPQVRNVATLGGNVAHALPAADGTIALLALDAFVEVARQSGSQIVPLQSLFRGPGKSTLVAGRDLIVGFHLPLRLPGQASAFKRIMRPQGVALPVLNAAVWLGRSGETVSDIRIAVGPGAGVPWRALEAEQALSSQVLDERAVTRAVSVLQQTANFRTSARRASAEYRVHLAVSLLRDALHSAWTRAARQGPH
jgi:carbon-monoxide dehydrogenase medium subunit